MANASEMENEKRKSKKWTGGQEEGKKLVLLITAGGLVLTEQ